MTSPTQHLEIFDEKFVDKFMDLNGNFAYEQMKDHETQDSLEVKRHLIQTVISVLEEQLFEIHTRIAIHTELSRDWTGIEVGQVLRHRIDPHEEKVEELEHIVDSLTTTLSTWKALL